MLAGVHLQHARQEALWEEEARQPEAGRGALLQPRPHEGDARDIVLDPGGQWLEGGVANLGPALRDLQGWQDSSTHTALVLWLIAT